MVLGDCLQTRHSRMRCEKATPKDVRIRKPNVLMRGFVTIYVMADSATLE